MANATLTDIEREVLEVLIDHTDRWKADSAAGKMPPDLTWSGEEVWADWGSVLGDVIDVDEPVITLRSWETHSPYAAVTQVGSVLLRLAERGLARYEVREQRDTYWAITMPGRAAIGREPLPG